jgi:hypothetical protein
MSFAPPLSDKRFLETVPVSGESLVGGYVTPPRLESSTKSVFLALVSLIIARISLLKAVISAGKKFPDANGFCGHSLRPPREEATKRLCNQLE